MTKEEVEIKKSLMNQLRLQGKKELFYSALVDDYVYYYRLKRILKKDIDNKGIRYKTMNGNGIETEKTNDSVLNLQKTTVTMLKILTDLNLKEQIVEGNNEEDYC